MSTKLIQTEKYLLLIDEEAEIGINESTYDFEICPCFGKNKHTEGIVWSFDDKIMHIGNFIETTQTGNSGYDTIKINGYRLYPIIAYYPLTKEAKELDLPLLPNPFKEVDVEMLADVFSTSDKVHPADSYISKVSYIEGYKSAQDRQFSLEDMKKAIEMARKGKLSFKFDNEGIVYKHTPEEIIQSLSTGQQLPKEFIPEYTWEWFNNVNDTGWENISPSDMDAIIAHGLKPQPEFRKRLKTMTNSEGKQELVGTYKY